MPDSSQPSPESGTSGSRPEAGKDALPRVGGPTRPPMPATVPGDEIGGPSGPEPTRYGDWERNGRCVDF